ncbi:reverse transcriptase family protein [Oceanobacter kriegii]|uniref:reverse transcriptase family protein n=1 Tax=Oceanobacter kriegii TaxID=64972 RepID=UPI000400F810|nr:reverse transcriptase family protein [Oceanobacter kriegii]
MSQNHLSKSLQTPLLAPKFSGTRISSVESLSFVLKTPIDELVSIADTSESYYRIHKEIEKPDGSIRKIYSVREPLKGIQRKINSLILKKCKYPEYLTGSLPNCTHIKNINFHVGQKTIISIDATNFFPSINASDVMNLWAEFFNFESQTSTLLTQLCSFQGGLAQGAPTSSYISNLVFWDVEPLIVQEFHRKGYIYSRYVDDICISKSSRTTKEEKTWAIKTAQKVFISKGLSIKSRKTKIMEKGSRQEVNKKTIHNGKVNASKADKDKIRAEIHNLKIRIDKNLLPDIPYEKRYLSIRGKILYLEKFNKTAAQKLQNQLDELVAYIKSKGVIWRSPKNKYIP